MVAEGKCRNINAIILSIILIDIKVKEMEFWLGYRATVLYRHGEKTQCSVQITSDELLTPTNRFQFTLQ